MSIIKIPPQDVEKYYQKLKSQVEKVGYHLHGDEEFTKELLESILINEQRYGYGACPCRLASGIIEQDRDIICPCDYRDPDINEYGSCYCGLYVSKEILTGKKDLQPIPERRPPLDKRSENLESKTSAFKDAKLSLAYPVWRCNVCGYLCAREEAPEVCPICKVSKERFKRFI